MSRAILTSILVIVYLHCGLLSAQTVTAAQRAEPARALDSLAEESWPANGPGGVIAVLHDGKTIFEKTYGLADLETNSPITPQTEFYLASLAKSFTAMGIMILKDHGELDFDDAASNYLAEVPKYAGAVTIRQLLTHTSGLPDHYDILGEERQGLTNETIVKLLDQQDSLLFTPGSDFSYSNSGYVLLADLIENVAGVPYRDFMRDSIFLPLGMTHTYVAYKNHPAIPNRAIGYTDTDSGWVKNDYHSFDIGPGGIYSTIGDLKKWDQAMYGNSLVSDSTLQEAFTVQLRTNGKRTPYGMGWMVECFDSPKYKGRLKNLCYIMQYGSLVGFRSFLQRFPDQKFTFIALSNTDNIDLMTQCAELFITPPNSGR